MKNKVLLLTLIVPLIYSCQPRHSELQSASLAVSPIKTERNKDRSITENFRSYWYSGVAELTTYELQQARYGNLNGGKAVLVFVTEPFETDKQVKADRPDDGNISVLKLNRIKKFLTGLYPYSIMTSAFHPVKQKGHALKVSNSIQEWCGQVYSQLNNREAFEIKAHSYFEREGDRQIELEKTILEDELWTLIRLAPEELPIGEHEILPSFEFMRLEHKPINAYTARLATREEGDLTIYTIDYPDLERSLKISFTTAFPHSIEAWEETTPGGFGSDGPHLTTTAKRLKRIQVPYWRLHDPEDEQLRNEIGL